MTQRPAAFTDQAADDAPSPAALSEILRNQRSVFLARAAPTLAERRADLDRLQRLLVVHRDAFADAVSRDFGHRSRHETQLTDLFATVEAIRHMRRHLGRWMRPERRPVSASFRPATARVLRQPLGVVGIISPWNYPVQLALSPLAAALAAGNRVMLKPSEHTPRTAALLKAVLAEAFAPDQVAVVTGGPAIGEAFARLPFDHLLFTGATAIGRHILHAAADNLVPVTLELGGKSPTIIDHGFPLERAVPAIVTGKFINAGQTCIAPDYVLVPEGQLGDFVDRVTAQVARAYPTLKDNPDYSSVVNQRHYDRLRDWIAEARAKGARVVEINPANEHLEQQAAWKIAPTLILDPTDDMTLMREEIFGPVLPVRTYRALDEAIAHVNERPRPLALYFFSDDKANQERVLARTTSGGVTLNDTLLHVAQEDLPFGGVGPSGMGAYHGREGFLTFSHSKAVLHQARWNLMGLMRPPYGRLIERVLGSRLK
ncbi:coniferyl aldehyde dehydrogenase [Zavarzinia sp. CC-PAN008]|uniref:coniferyl aldehyde dehydrogenase n=1 Tax=Zavarzinia sp. CC-PAN008 TaxID=3243332 RepID=UPI003F74870B